MPYPVTCQHHPEFFIQDPGSNPKDCKCEAFSCSAKEAVTKNFPLPSTTKKTHTKKKQQPFKQLKNNRRFRFSLHIFERLPVAPPSGHFVWGLPVVPTREPPDSSTLDFDQAMLQAKSLEFGGVPTGYKLRYNFGYTPEKLTYHLKIDIWKRKFLLESIIF